jgi:hypothetical protein
VIGTRDELTAAVEAAVRPDEPERLLVVFRIGGFADFANRFGNKSMEMIADFLWRQLPDSAGCSSIYFRPREDELCALIEDPLLRAEEALSAAARTFNEAFGADGIALGYSNTPLPSGLGGFTEAIRRVDRRIVDADAKRMTRSYRTDFMALRSAAVSPNA